MCFLNKSKGVFKFAFLSHILVRWFIFFKRNAEFKKKNRAFTSKNTHHLQIAVDPYIFPIVSAQSDDA